MNDSCTIRVSDKGGSLDTEAAVFMPFKEKVEDRLIFYSFEVFSFDFFNDFKFLFSEIIFESAFSKDEYFIAFEILDFDIYEVGIDS